MSGSGSRSASTTPLPFHPLLYDGAPQPQALFRPATAPLHARSPSPGSHSLYYAHSRRGSYSSLAGTSSDLSRTVYPVLRAWAGAALFAYKVEGLTHQPGGVTEATWSTGGTP